MAATAGDTPVIVVVGLGPAGSDLTTAAALGVLRAASESGTPVFYRTARHAAAAELLAGTGDRSNVHTFDDHYARADTFEAVYGSIVSTLLTAATGSSDGRVVYAVPGSPFVAERTVELLRGRAGEEGAAVRLEVIPGLSFADLAWGRLGIDPVAEGVRLVDGLSFARASAGDHGPLLVAQCWSASVLSDVKLALEDPAHDQRAVVLHHLGLGDERVVDVAWEDLDRAVAADHLTSVYIARLAAPVAGEVMGLVETVATLRQQCPWDRQQTHQSLLRHLVEETYEAIEALEALGDDPSEAPAERVAHAEEELGDLLCHVVFHATLAREEGLFDLADVARTIDEKLVRRHPHVFSDTVAATATDVEASWERNKRQEKRQRSLLEGVPAGMPSLARAATIERKLASVGLGWNAGASPGANAGAGHNTGPPDGLSASATPPDPKADGDQLLALARSLASSGRDPEGLLRQAIDRLVAHVAELEASAAARGIDVADLPAEPSDHT